MSSWWDWLSRWVLYGRVLQCASLADAVQLFYRCTHRIENWGHRLTDESALERARGRLVRPFSEAGDPWLTEAKVVAAHGALQRCQATEREFLSRAFTRVKDLELQRTAAIKDVISAFVVAYK